MSFTEIKNSINKFTDEKKKKNKQSKKHIISILFSTYTDFASRMIYYRSGGGFTHVSISLDDKREYFYAFNTKGFRKEYPRKHKRVLCNLCYFLEITHSKYKKLCKAIKKIERNSKKYKYNYFGIACCMFGIPLKTKYRYFCSQFVAKLLEIAEIIKLKKSASRYLPNQLNKEIRNCPFIVGRVENCFAI